MSSLPDLRQFDVAYAAISHEELGAHVGVPDGEYPVVIEDVELTTSQTSGTPMLVWTFRIADGPQANRQVRKYRPITGRTLPWVKEELTECGLQLSRFSELPERLPELLAKQIRIVKRTKDGNANVYVVRSHTQPAPAATMADEAAPF